MLKRSFLARLLLALPKVLKLSKWNLLIPVVIVGIVGLIEGFPRFDCWLYCLLFPLFG